MASRHWGSRRNSDGDRSNPAVNCLRIAAAEQHMIPSSRPAPSARAVPSAPASLPRRPVTRVLQPFRAAGLALALAVVATAYRPAYADQQMDPGLKDVVTRAIAQAQCFADRFDSAVWYKLMEPRLRREVPDQAERVEILKYVYCETHRAGEKRLPPGLVMALIEVESRFDRWAVSSAGAVGLMQVMPFWPEQLGMRRYQLTRIGPNVQMGCAILRYYLDQEHNNYTRALARYNGSPGRRNYSDAVLSRWARWTGADDLPGTTAPAARVSGTAQTSQPVRNPRGG
jgi:soluble lytic murein transglycosylase-like protein